MGAFLCITQGVFIKIRATIMEGVYWTASIYMYHTGGA